MDQSPLIVGAGPVGLAAALFLGRHGRVPRIVEMRDAPRRESRALAVNPRTLDILESSGLAKEMLQRGTPIKSVCFYRGHHAIGRLSFARVHPRYPFMLALSQATTERLLARAVDDVGGKVEHGVTMVACRSIRDGVEVTLEPSGGGATEVIRCSWLFAADGVHSITRQRMEVEFRGSSLGEPWHLADAPMRSRLAADQAHIFFLDDGAFYFTIRVVDEESSRTSHAIQSGG
jgi:2-polyprenyl-6-methoxyphenol hydroxylase-like FAD-dependent oxidoreductase